MPAIVFESTFTSPSQKAKKKTLSPIYYSNPLVVPSLTKMGMSLDEIMRMMYQREHFQLVPLMK
tara:strand:- start:181 stop:372 length:192 start_codon:yes stop_codon:yes gene_type:complete